MSPLRLGPHDLLEYDARYKVLICRECKYAIQKSALQSHLLRHKIYREERQQLLSSLAQLDIVEPHLVSLPNRDSPPMESLPTIAGYCCLAPDCGSLCASSKRMRRHQSELHGVPDSNNFSSLARPATLQTFFRGTKLRYFEVSSPTEDSTTHSPPVPPTHVDEDNVRHAEEEPAVLDDAYPTTSTEPPRRTNAHDNSIHSPPVNLDLDILNYFHHFIMKTSNTLPTTDAIASCYWQRDITAQALTQRWIMCGLLAISACHLALLTEESAPDATLAHHQRLIQLSSMFFSGHDEIVRSSTSFDLLGLENEGKRAGDQLACVLSFAQSAIDSHTVSHSAVSISAKRSQLQRLVTGLRYLVTYNSSPNDGNNSRNTADGEEEGFRRVARILRTCSSDDMLSATLNRIGGLPSRMMEVFGRPESTNEVLEVIAATAALIESCSLTFKSAEPCSSWQGLAIWFTRVSFSFDEMVFQNNPAALVVLAHWAALLVNRAEQCGCWVLRGTAKSLTALIDVLLPADNLALRSLLAGL